MTKISAPAKIILLGEHVVVYGQPAIAVPILSLRAYAEVRATSGGSGLNIIAKDLNRVLPVDLNTEVSNEALEIALRLILEYLHISPPNIDIIIQSDIPIASGLGSGAAISTVIARAISSAVGYKFEPDELNDLVFQVEKIHHGTPSGIDNTVIVYEQPIYFVRGQGINLLQIQGEFSFLVADTGIAALTRVAVNDVATLYQTDIGRWESLFQSVGDLVRRARIALETANYTELGLVMNQNHQYLQELTVSSPELDKLVQAALDAGALGAKLSGGGRGGNMIALITPESRTQVEAALLRTGAVRVFQTVLS